MTKPKPKVLGPKRKTGRPKGSGKLTPENVEKILKALKLGNYRVVACAFAGIDKDTFGKWMREGAKNPDGPYGAFRRSVIEAENSAEIRNVGIVQTAARTDAKHAQWWLSRKHSKRWANKERFEHTGKDGEPLTIQIQKISIPLTDEKAEDSDAIQEPGSAPFHDDGGE